MDNFRVTRRPVATRRPIDSFSAPVDRKQIVRPFRTTAPEALLPTQVPVEVVSAPPAELAPPAIKEKNQYLGSQDQNHAAEADVQQPITEAAATAGQATPFDLALIEDVEQPKNRLTAGRSFRRWMLRGGLSFLVLLIATGGVLFAQGYSKAHKVFKGTASPAASLQANVSPSLLKGEGDGRVNFLLLGNGGNGHEAPDLTDTMIVVSVDPVNKKAAMLSVPRDLWVKVPQYGAMKINATYEVGKYNYLGKIDDSNSNSKAVQAGFAMADQAVETVLGIKIHYNGLVNFKSFKQAVDTVGGVTVNVPEQLYDPTIAWENHNNPVIAAAGVQQMNGSQALLYARSRETSSDFARSQRQRSLLLGLKDKALSLGTLSNPVKLSGLLSAFGDNVATDMGISEAMRAYDIAKTISNDNISNFDLVTAPNNLVTTGTMSGVSIDQPKAGLFQYDAIQQFVRSTLKDGYLTNENAQITVLNGTAKEGLATTKANELKSYGYNVTQVGNAPTKAYPKTVLVDYTNGKDKYTLNYLQNRYGVTAVSAAPDPSIQPGTANFLVILGSDQAQ